MVAIAQQMSLFDDEPVADPLHVQGPLRQAIAEAEQQLGRPITFDELLRIRTWVAFQGPQAPDEVEAEAVAYAREQPLAWYFASLKGREPIAGRYIRQLPKEQRQEIDRLIAAVARETSEERIAEMLARVELTEDYGGRGRLLPSAYCLAFLAKARTPQEVRKILDHCGVVWGPATGPTAAREDGHDSRHDEEGAA